MTESRWERTKRKLGLVKQKVEARAEPAVKPAEEAKKPAMRGGTDTGWRLAGVSPHGRNAFGDTDFGKFGQG